MTGPKGDQVMPVSRGWPSRVRPVSWPWGGVLIADDTARRVGHGDQLAVGVVAVAGGERCAGAVVGDGLDS